jgi:pimeloyl-ACP methyl ester carboxylesterase
MLQVLGSSLRRSPPSRSVFLLSFLLCVASQVAYAQSRFVERTATPFIEASKAIELELVIYAPQGRGPFRTVVFNHGSTGRGANPAEFRRTYAPEYVANFFTARGWLVVFPQRRGRGNSDGTYAEGLRTDGTGYSCDPKISLPGLERAIADLDVVLNAVAARSEVDRTRIIMAGVSRGGILSLAFAAQHPGKLIAAVNFVGGWMADSCPEIDAINLRTFQEAAAFKRPTLWLYGTEDTFYSIEHSRRNFEAFRSAGGSGTFHSIAVGGYSGHYLLDSPDLWRNQMSSFLESLP